MIRRLFILVFFLSVLSCGRMEQMELPDGRFVNVSLGVSVDCAETVTKSVDESTVRNLWVILYEYGDGTGEAVLKGEPVYIDDFPAFYSDADNRMIKLVASSNPCTIVFLANTFEDKEQFQITQGSTLTKLKQRFRSIASSDDVLGDDGNGGLYPIFSDCHYMSSGISENTVIEARLKRNLAKVRINVQKGVDCDVAISSVQLCSVSDKSYYLTNYEELASPFPSADNHSTFDYAPVAWPAGETSLVIDTWLPVNMRGVSSQNVSQTDKNRYAPDGSTCLLVSGTYTEGSQTIPVSYKFYLGGNMVDDYNIKPNGNYTYSFAINARGDSSSDSRIEDMGLVDFTGPRYELANSYVLNPGTTVKRLFRIPVQRILTFWGTDDHVYYEDDSCLSLRDNDGRWRAFVLQSDFEIANDNFVLTKSAGTAPGDSYFEVEVAPGTEGNVIVAVGPDDGSGKVSWSWHLWITDYDPDPALDWGEGTDGKYVYPVKNGAVHRYEGTFWSKNKTHYMMDRNLGWTSDPHVYPDDNKGLLYYQFGRKDPFIFADKIASVSYSKANEENGVLFSIQNPLTFIKSSDSYWTSSNRYNPAEYNKHILWNDPRTVPGAQNEGKKSVFDPCPPGYRVPQSAVWSDFRYNSSDQRTTNTFPDGDYKEGDVIDDSAYKGGFNPYNSIKGLQYWPFQGDGVLIPDLDMTVYIPASGFIEPSSAVVRSHGNGRTDGTVDASGERWSFLWAEAPKSEKQGSGYTSQPDHLSSDNSTWRTRACPVRCITDK